MTDICAPSNPMLAARLEQLYRDGTLVWRGKTYPCLPKTREELKGKRHESLYPPIPDRMWEHKDE